MVNVAEIVVARKDAITPKSVLRILDSAHKDNQPTLFKIVTELATEPMVSTLIAFSRNADWEGRYCIAQTIAPYTMPISASANTSGPKARLASGNSGRQNRTNP